MLETQHDSISGTDRQHQIITDNGANKMLPHQHISAPPLVNYYQPPPTNQPPPPPTTTNQPTILETLGDHLFSTDPNKFRLLMFDNEEF